MPLLSWNIYDIITENSAINGVRLRGRIRKLCIENGQNVMVENTTDRENGVRFAILADDSPDQIIAYLKSVLADVRVELVRENVVNPVLSKLKVNIVDRYQLD